MRQIRANTVDMLQDIRKQKKKLLHKMRELFATDVANLYEKLIDAEMNAVIANELLMVE